MSETTTVLEKSKGKDSVELLEEIASKYGITIEKGSGLVGSEINDEGGKGGFMLMNFSPIDAIKYLANISTCKG